MDERDGQMAVLALGLTVALLAAQVALVAWTVFGPMAGVLYRLVDEDPTEPEVVPERETAAQEQRRPLPVGAILAGIAALASAGIAAWAAVRLYRGTLFRDRWTWALVLSGVGCAWGIMMSRFLSRVPPFVDVLR